MRKKLFAVLLTLVLAFGLFPLFTLAAETEGDLTEATVSEETNDALETAEDGVEALAGEDEAEAYASNEEDEVEAEASNEETETEFPASGTCGDNLTWTLSNGTLTVSGTGEMQDYLWWPSNAPWYEQRSDITAVVIGSGVISIGNFAFFECTSLTSVTIPDSVTSIGDAAFSRCTSLTSVTIHSNTTRIGDYAFDGCTSLASVAIPDSVTSIGEYAFEGCTSLVGVTIPSSVTGIQYGSFADCDSLTNVVIPDSIQIIQTGAFVDCDSLNDIVVDSTDTLIAYGALGMNNGEPMANAIIYGYIDSTAQSYATENQVTFVAINDWSMQNGVPYFEFTVVPESSSTSYVLDSGGSITIYCTGQLENFVQLLIDGQVVDPDNYQLAEGSTIVTLLGAYLDTFSVGKHTVELQYTNGAAQVEITILERGAALPANQNGASGSLDRSPQTGVESRFTLWITLSLVSFAGIAAIVVFRRKIWN